MQGLTAEATGLKGLTECTSSCLKYKSGIYFIYSAVNKRIYIGQSKDVGIRLRQHLYDLKRGASRNCKLQSTFNKYGESNLEVGVIRYCPLESLDYIEIQLIAFYKSINLSMNLDSGGNLNKKASDETKHKQSLAKAGKISNWKGMKASDELRAKLSLAHKGLPSPRKGKKTGNPSWNSGKTGLQVSNRRNPVSVIDRTTGINIGSYDSKQHFLKSINYKSKNYTKLSDTITRVGRYDMHLQLSSI